MSAAKKLFEQAINEKQIVKFDYSGKSRIAQPKEIFGEQVLVLQTGGETSKGTIEKASIKRFAFEKIENFEVIGNFLDD